MAGVEMVGRSGSWKQRRHLLDAQPALLVGELAGEFLTACPERTS
jgi:hypothetical protein